MRSSRKLAAGLADASLAALGTFLAGIVAVRELDTRALAVYAVLFSATVLGMLLPRQLHYVPAQLGANLEPDLRSPLVGRDARRARLVSAGTFLIAVGSGLSLVGSAPVAVCLGMGLMAGLYAVVSPLQDHIRAALHLVDRHASAAVCSVVLAATVGAGTVFGLTHHGAPGLELLPFGALFAGNVLSIGVGVLLLRGAPRHQGYVQQAVPVRARLLFSEVAVQGGWFACNYAILLVLGGAVLAHLEAARVVASPITILTAALVTFMGPAVLRRLRSTPENPHGPRRDVLLVSGMVALGGALYIGVLALFGPVVSAILNKPLDLALASARIGEYVVEGVSTIVTLVVFAMGRTRLALGNSVVAGGAGFLGTLVLAAPLGPFALPVAQTLGMAARLVSSSAGMERGTRASALEPEPAVA
ncbi:MAG TPA: hypothetical protein VGO26_00800 [Amnibacterium sp.]|nr:hypothetical protein [Amnibacterium sp.]